MANTILVFENGIITRYYDTYKESITDDGLCYAGNGWKVNVYEKSLEAVCCREYHDGTHEIRVKICEGKMNTVLTVNGKCVSSKTKPCDFHGEGEIGLSGGNVDERYVYFRSAEFLKFLEKYDILAKYKLGYDDLKADHIDEKTALLTELYTDGTVKVKERKNILGDTIYSYDIKNASAVLTISTDSNRRSGYVRILKTNINDLNELDKIIPTLNSYSLTDGWRSWTFREKMEAIDEMKKRIQMRD